MLQNFQKPICKVQVFKPQTGYNSLAPIPPSGNLGANCINWVANGTLADLLLLLAYDKNKTLALALRYTYLLILIPGFSLFHPSWMLLAVNHVLSQCIHNSAPHWSRRKCFSKEEWGYSPGRSVPSWLEVSSRYCKSWAVQKRMYVALTKYGSGQPIGYSDHADIPVFPIIS